MAFKDKTVFGVVGDLRFTEVQETPTTGQGIYVYLVLERIFAACDLFAHLFPFPVKPIGDMGKFRLAPKCGQRTVLVKIPALTAFGAIQFCAFGCHLGFGQAMRTQI